MIACSTLLHCSRPRLMHQFLCTIALFLVFARADDEWHYPPSGFATMTHYEMPLDYIASCGCAPPSTHYPTVALSQLAFGSATAYGPGCGVCFKLSLRNTFLSDPQFFPPTPRSLIVKVTDLCPITSTWCDATESKPNKAGHYLNFDLAFPSPAIPSDFFPSDQTLYGYTDFGVWNVSYDAVPCEKEWAGASNSAALGSVANLGDSVCCPADPLSNENTTCPSFSLQNGVPPNTTTTGLAVHDHRFTYTAVAIVALLYITISIMNIVSC